MHDFFVSYRREDAAAWAGRLVADLRRELPSTQVFQDISAIAGGEDFVEAIHRALSTSVAFLVLIGPRWLEIRTERGTRRLEDPEDLVGLEIREALQRPELKVIPVLVGGARLPRAEDLPGDLRPLVRRQAHEISESRWDYDISRLVANLRGIRDVRGPAGGKQRALRMALAAGTVAAIGAALWYASWRGSALDIASLKPGDVFRECKECPEMVVVAPGTFVMGAESDASRSPNRESTPAHTVTIAQPFAIGKYEVTVGEFRAFVEQTKHKVTPCTYLNWQKFEYVADGGADWSNPTFAQGERHPVVCVGRVDARAYVKWLNDKVVGKGGTAVYRLPSEAEWEYAARGGTRGASYWAAEQAASDRTACAHANLLDETNVMTAGRTRTGERFPCADGYADTAPVDDPAFKPNAFGLSHVVGNAEEWVEDCWHEDYADAPSDGRVRAGGDCSRGVVRGGDFTWGMQIGVGTHSRTWRLASSAGTDSGFRVARTLGRGGGQ
jgi:formylglycine-generating enzyme required for sulfatase activity